MLGLKAGAGFEFALDHVDKLAGTGIPNLLTALKNIGSNCAVVQRLLEIVNVRARLLLLPADVATSIVLTTARHISRVCDLPLRLLISMVAWTRLLACCEVVQQVGLDESGTLVCRKRRYRRQCTVAHDACIEVDTPIPITRSGTGWLPPAS